MKANELMIGDWVHIHYNNFYTGEVSFDFKVTQMTIHYGDELLIWGESADGKHHGNMGEVSKIEPIPLTAEILEKNGYTQSLLPKGYVYKFEDDRVMTLERFADYWVVRIYGNQIPMECRSVHELQHALRLCGIDKEITI